MKQKSALNNMWSEELLRYILNGVLATGVHYSILTWNINILNIASAGLANLIAAFFGITTSFLGSRYFVFRMREKPIVRQAMSFLALYATIACLHGTILFLWSDIYKQDYRIGFILATILQFLLSYFGNKLLVFKS